jgi:hypothetical protein
MDEKKIFTEFPNRVVVGIVSRAPHSPQMGGSNGRQNPIRN